jgi:hypothetical protein
MLIGSMITMIQNEGTSTSSSSSSMRLEENDTCETAMQTGRALARCTRPWVCYNLLHVILI